MTSKRREFARLLRKQPTKAEDILWERLRGSRFGGAKFRRQVPFDRFVVDFYCRASKLVIELDGKQHEWLSDYDAERTQILEGLGVRVMRFTNAEVCDDLDSVLFANWRRVAGALRVMAGFPHPCPSPERERGAHLAAGDWTPLLRHSRGQL